MELVFTAIFVVVVLGARGGTLGRREGRNAEALFHASAPGVRVERQFERPGREDELF